jgi:hypothetical protein
MGLLLLAARPASARQAHDMSKMGMGAAGWSWSVDAEAFLNLNLQERKFRSFRQVEAPNWFMVAGHRQIGSVTVMLHGMISFEPFTFRRLGSAEVFQTGETDLQGLPLVDYQHPHDLLMGAGAAFDWAVGASHVTVEVAPVGSPALGPVAFMHRPSAEANPTAPLGHHNLDSTHITHGVVTAGFTRGAIRVEASVFRGREPDAHRIRVEFGALDSYAARVTWSRGGWQAQVSAGHLTRPDPTEFTDIDRFTGSVAYQGRFRQHPVALVAAWGLNREPGLGVTTPAWLVEGTWHASARDLIYVRGELVDKDILTAGGYEPPAGHQPHILSRIGAWTTGYLRQLGTWAGGEVGIGGDATVYRTPPNLLESYGHPFSAHVFLRCRFARQK